MGLLIVAFAACLVAAVVTFMAVRSYNALQRLICTSPYRNALIEVGTKLANGGHHRLGLAMIHGAVDSKIAWSSKPMTMDVEAAVTDKLGEFAQDTMTGLYLIVLIRMIERGGCKGLKGDSPAKAARIGVKAFGNCAHPMLCQAFDYVLR